MTPQIDLVIPVYNEGANILPTLRALSREVKTPTRVLICYDFEEDDTLPAVRANPDSYTGDSDSDSDSASRHGQRGCSHDGRVPRSASCRFAT